MDLNFVNLPPGDPQLINTIVSHLKSQGLFDQFRRDCLADVDTKPAYQNLRHRVESYVANFLQTQEWRPDLNKNQLRDTLRRQINQSGMLAIGVDRIVEQVVNPKVYRTFFPQIESVVFKLLGKELPPSSVTTNIINTTPKEEPSPPLTAPIPEFSTSDKTESDKSILLQSDNIKEEPMDTECTTPVLNEQPSETELKSEIKESQNLQENEPCKNTVETQTDASAFTENVAETTSPSIEASSPKEKNFRTSDSLRDENKSSSEDKLVENKMDLSTEIQIKKEVVKNERGIAEGQESAGDAGIEKQDKVKSLDVPKKSPSDSKVKPDFQKKSEQKSDKCKHLSDDKNNKNNNDSKNKQTSDKKSRNEIKPKTPDGSGKVKHEHKHSSPEKNDKEKTPSKSSSLSEKSIKVQLDGNSRSSESNKQRSSSNDKHKHKSKQTESSKSSQSHSKSKSVDNKNKEDQSKMPKSPISSSSKSKNTICHAEKICNDKEKQKQLEKHKGSEAGKSDKHKSEKNKSFGGKNDSHAKSESKAIAEKKIKIETTNDEAKTKLDSAKTLPTSSLPAKQSEAKTKEKNKESESHRHRDQKDKPYKESHGKEKCTENKSKNVDSKTSEKPKKHSEGSKQKINAEKNNEEKPKNDDKTKNAQKTGEKSQTEIKPKAVEMKGKDASAAIKNDVDPAKSKHSENVGRNRSDSFSKTSVKPKPTEPSDKFKTSDKEKNKEAKPKHGKNPVVDKEKAKDRAKAEVKVKKDDDDKTSDSQQSQERAESKSPHRKHEGSESENQSSNDSPEKSSKHHGRKRKHSDGAEETAKKIKIKKSDAANSLSKQTGSADEKKNDSCKKESTPQKEQQDEQRKSSGEWSDVTVSSVHTSDLSDFDDHFSLTDSGGETDKLTSSASEKASKKRKRDSPKVKGLNDRGRQERSHKGRKNLQKLYDEELWSPDDNKKKSSDDKDHGKIPEKMTPVDAEPRRELRRQRKVNPRYSSNEFSSIFSKGKDKLHYADFEESHQDEEQEKPKQSTRENRSQDESKEEFVKQGRGRKSATSSTSECPSSHELDVPYSPRSTASENEMTTSHPRKGKERDSGGRSHSPKSDASFDSTHLHGSHTPDSVVSVENKRRCSSSQHYESSDLYKPRPTIRGGRRNRSSDHQRYDDSDLYKPRPVITASSRRSRAASPSPSPIDVPNSKPSVQQRKSVQSAREDNGEKELTQQENIEQITKDVSVVNEIVSDGDRNPSISHYDDHNDESHNNNDDEDNDEDENDDGGSDERSEDEKESEKRMAGASSKHQRRPSFEKHSSKSEQNSNKRTKTSKAKDQGTGSSSRGKRQNLSDDILVKRKRPKETSVGRKRKSS